MHFNVQPTLEEFGNGAFAVADIGEGPPYFGITEARN